MRRRSVQIEPGKAACSFFSVSFFSKLVTILPSGRHSVWICPVWFFFSLLWRTREPLVLLDIQCLIINSFVFIFLFLFCEAYWSGLGGRKAIYEQWSGFAGRVFHRDFLGLVSFSIHLWNLAPFRCCCKFSWELLGCVGTADPRDPGKCYMAHVCGLDTAAWKGIQDENIRLLNKLVICPCVMFVYLPLDVNNCEAWYAGTFLPQKFPILALWRIEDACSLTQGT